MLFVIISLSIQYVLMTCDCVIVCFLWFTLWGPMNCNPICPLGHEITWTELNWAELNHMTTCIAWLLRHAWFSFTVPCILAGTHMRLSIPRSTLWKNFKKINPKKSITSLKRVLCFPCRSPSYSCTCWFSLERDSALERRWMWVCPL